MADGAIERDNTRVRFCGAEMGYSRTVRAGDFIYVSGHTAVDEQGRIGEGDIRDQTRLCFAKLRKTLERVGCTLDDVIKVTAYLADPRDFWIMNDVFNEAFPTDRPTRTTVTAQPVLATRIEIDVVVYKPR